MSNTTADPARTDPARQSQLGGPSPTDGRSSTRPAFSLVACNLRIPAPAERSLTRRAGPGMAPLPPP